MNTFPDNIRFKYSWRSYQQAVLEKLDEFVTDRQLHIVAPPGSGKTVLGLEVSIRLNKPTLILAPTLTIRDQWIDRLCQLFLNCNDIPEWISTDIRNPLFLTVVTYQGLHMACATDNELSEVVAKLKSRAVETFVLDEAHHLKSQWWETLNKVKQAIDPIIVALTATPPYDSDFNEWKKYQDMNGEIDMEISVPELIKENDLCPHQDYVYFSQPTAEELTKIAQYREERQSLLEELSRNELLLSSFQKSSLWVDPENHLEWIYENISVYSSFLIFILHNDIDIPLIHIQVLGLDVDEFNKQKPEFTSQRLEEILNYFLFRDQLYFVEYTEQKELLIKHLKKKGVIERNAVKLSDSKDIDKLLSTSNSKIRSIVDIAKFEHLNMGNRLRMVILSDFIRDEYLNLARDEKEADIKQMGVIPIFETLLNNRIGTEKIGVLTGSVVVLPKGCIGRLTELCKHRNIDFTESLYTIHRNNYLLLSSNTIIKNIIVSVVTQLFTEGFVEILVGTKSLLGEGWDAPAINSLVLASFVGSFVLSNQMRGRAIRIERDNPEKTGAIWHLVCIDPTTNEGGKDLETLSRRFKSFVGISNTDKVYIENGLDRLSVTQQHYTYSDVEALNGATLEAAKDRQKLKSKWEQAIAEGSGIVNELKIPYPEEEPPYNKMIKFYYRKSVNALIICVLLATVLLASVILLYFDICPRAYRWIAYSLGIISAVSLYLFNRKRAEILKIYMKYKGITSDIENIASVLINSLSRETIFTTPLHKLRVETDVDEMGTISCRLKGATRLEQSIFADALGEILTPVDNPRYMIERKDKESRISKLNYHALPLSLATNKKTAQYFHSQWTAKVGLSDLIYTRTIEGRKMLLKARVQSLASLSAKTRSLQRYRRWA